MRFNCQGYLPVRIDVSTLIEVYLISGRACAPPKSRCGCGMMRVRQVRRLRAEERWPPWGWASHRGLGPSCLAGDSLSPKCARHMTSDEKSAIEAAEKGGAPTAPGWACHWLRGGASMCGGSRANVVQLPRGWPGAPRALDASSALPGPRLRCGDLVGVLRLHRLGSWRVGGAAVSRLVGGGFQFTGLQF